jgi:hypothetical protein
MWFSRRSVSLITLTAFCGCSGPPILASDPTEVTVRYDGVFQTLSDATIAAGKACATFGKTAQLRRTEVIVTFERYAHFDCVSS